MIKASAPLGSRDEGSFVTVKLDPPAFLGGVPLSWYTVLRDGEMNNIIILQHQKTLCFSPFNLTVQSGHQFCPKSENLVFKQDYSFP